MARSIRRRAFTLAALTAVSLMAQVGSRDRYFARYAFDRWQTEADKSQIRWSIRVRPAKLSAHQRMMARVELEIDAGEVQKRRGRGELAMLLQIEDVTGRRWRNHKGFDLSQFPKDAKAHSVIYYQDLFLLPGEYRLAFALCDSENGEYSFSRRPLRVAPLRNDTLAQSWNDLPAVEDSYVRSTGRTTGFSRYIRGRLRLGLDTQRPVHVDLVMNMTPSERALGSVRTFRRNMSVLIPALKVLAGMDVRRGSLDVTLLDLTRRKTWEQKDARGLDWKKMRMPVAENQPGLIDAQSLAAKPQMTDFFRNEVLGRALPGPKRDELRVVIVLSAPAFLEHQDRLEPVSLDRGSESRVVFICVIGRPRRVRISHQACLVPGRAAVSNSIPDDGLEQALKPLDARILTSATPEEVPAKRFPPCSPTFDACKSGSRMKNSFNRVIGRGKNAAGNV